MTLIEPTTAAERPLVSGSSTRPQTAEEYLESLNDGRSVYIYGEKIDNIVTHPAYRNSAASIARMYSALHDPAQNSRLLAPTDTGSGGHTHAFFKLPYSREDLVAGRDAIYDWQKLVYGWMGRTPDYKASLMVSLGASPEFFGEFAPNAQYWYRRQQEEVLHIGHAIVHPPVDRQKGIEEVRDVFVRVDREVDGGVVVSGAKVVATGAPLTQYVFVSHFGAPLKDKAFALVFMAPVNGKGVKLISRHSYESSAARGASPFDYPLSSRFDENDAILVFDEAFIPWENVLIYDSAKVQEWNSEAGMWLGRAALQAATRLQVKLEFIIGLVTRALEITGAGEFRGVQAQLGELINFRNYVAGMRDAAIHEANPSLGGMLTPNAEYSFAFAAMTPGMYTRMKAIIEGIIASGLIYLNSSALDFMVPEIRADLDRFMRGSNGNTALDRSKVMKALWDSIGSEFGARHELYELNYWGQPEKSYLDILGIAQEKGDLDNYRSFAESFMDEYDLTGWKATDLSNPSDVSFLPIWNTRK